MKSKDSQILEEAYRQILLEQYHLIEEGKIWDFIKSMGNKLKNAWDIINVKLISNPKIYKGLVIAGPIIASLIAKNFQNAEISSDAVKSLLETLNGVDPNVSADDLQDLLGQWEKDHSASFTKFGKEGNVRTSTTLDMADKDGQYSFGGEHFASNKALGRMPTDSDGMVINTNNSGVSVESMTQSLESIATKSDISTAITSFFCNVIKTSNLDGSGTTALVEYSGSVTASSPQEAMKIMSELVKTAIQKSGIDIQNLNFEQPKVAIAAATESLYTRNSNLYLTELQALDKLKSMAKGAANKIVSGANAVKSVADKITIGAKDIVNKIKSTFKKAPGVPEKQYKVTLRVGMKPQKQNIPV